MIVTQAGSPAGSSVRDGTGSRAEGVGVIAGRPVRQVLAQRVRCLTESRRCAEVSSQVVFQKDGEKGSREPVAGLDGRSLGNWLRELELHQRLPGYEPAALLSELSRQKLDAALPVELAS